MSIVTCQLLFHYLREKSNEEHCANLQYDFMILTLAMRWTCYLYNKRTIQGPQIQKTAQGCN